MPVISVSNLVKTYGDVRAVNGIEFNIEQGEVFALLGPNGAGKTTAVEILEGHRKRTSGDVSVLGFDPHDAPREFRDRIGIVLQQSAIEAQLSVKEAIDIYGALYRKRRPTGELIELVGLEEKAHARIKTLSGGQKRRLELALGIVGDPDMIFLDEPTTGFDPSARRQAWGVIENLVALDKTVLLTTHYMDEAQHLADRVAVIVGGSIVAEGTPESLGGRETSATLITFRADLSAVDGFPLADVSVSTDGVVAVRSTTPTRDVYTISGWAVERGVELDDLRVTRPSLEDVYLDLTREDV